MSPLADLDLNLLLVLDALLAERNVTRAAARVGLSQPAMSSALGRLRKRLGDPLLVRTAEGMLPTPRALALAMPVREALSTLEQALESASDFDPARARRTFTVACTEYAQLVLVPDLVRRLGERAPLASLSVVAASDGAGIAAELERGRAELAFAALYRDDGPGVLLRDRWVCAVRADHPLREGLSAEALLGADHLAVQLGSDAPEPIDKALAQRGLSRRVTLRVPQLAAAALATAGGDRLWVAPERVVDRFAPLGLRALALPVELPPLGLRMAWPKRHHHDPAQAWLRGLVLEMLGGVHGTRVEACGERCGV